MRNFIFSLLLFVTILFNSSFAQELEITLSIDKTNYLKYETIKAVAELKNISLDDFAITQPFLAESYGSGIEVLLFDSLNNKIPARDQHALDAYMTRDLELKPNESLITLLHLSRWFGEKIPEGNFTGGDYRTLEPGKYKLQSTYEYIAHNTRQKTNSNIVGFEIIKPTEKDLNIFSDIRNITSESLGISTEQYLENLSEAINKYPQSSYVLGVYYGFFQSADSATTELKEKMLKMIEDYPSSFVTLASLLNSKNKGKDFMKLAESQLKEKSELNKTMLEKYENYQKIRDRK